MSFTICERSDEEEEEEPETVDVTQLRKEKEELLKKIEEINAKLPVETPKESSKKGKQQKKLLKEKEDAERAAALEKAKSDAQVSTQRKIEESDFENAQDLIGSGSSVHAAEAGQGKFESWVLNSTTKLADVEAFSKHAAAKIQSFEKEFLYISLLRTLLQETTKNVDVLQTKELLLVLTKGKDGFNVVDLIRSLLRDADKDISPEDIAKEVAKEGKEEKAKPQKGKELAKLTSRQELLKLLLHDLVKDTGSEVVARIISEVWQPVYCCVFVYNNFCNFQGCGVTLTKDQEKQVHKKRQDLTGDPNSKKAEQKVVRPSDHKSMEMYDAFGKGGGDDWGGGGGTRGDE